MVDNSRIADYSGNDMLVNNLRFSTPTVEQGFGVIDNLGGGVTVVSGTTSTLTLSVMKTGLIVTTNAAAVTLTFDTAANIIAALNATTSGAQIGDTIIITISCHGAGGITINTSTGVTNPNGAANTLTQGTQRNYILTVTGIITPALVFNA